MPQPNKFSYKNYFRATPANLQRVTIAAKTIVMSVAGATFFTGNEKYAAMILFAGAVLTEIANFFGHADEDYQKLNLQIEGKDITVTKTE